jgi:hypothetical protein
MAREKSQQRTAEAARPRGQIRRRNCFFCRAHRGDRLQNVSQLAVRLGKGKIRSRRITGAARHQVQVAPRNRACTGWPAAVRRRGAEERGGGGRAIAATAATAGPCWRSAPPLGRRPRRPARRRGLRSRAAIRPHSSPAARRASNSSTRGGAAEATPCARHGADAGSTGDRAGALAAVLRFGPATRPAPSSARSRRSIADGIWSSRIRVDRRRSRPTISASGRYEVDRLFQDVSRGEDRGHPGGGQLPSGARRAGSRARRAGGRRRGLGLPSRLQVLAESTCRGRRGRAAEAEPGGQPGDRRGGAEAGRAEPGGGPTPEPALAGVSGASKLV